MRGKHPGRSSQEETVGSENPWPGVLMSTQGKVRRERASSHRPAVGKVSDRRSSTRAAEGPSRPVAKVAPVAVAPSSTGGSVADVEAHITGTVWKIECEVGDDIEEGDTVVILESMKMEMPVEAEDAGTVREILCEEGQAVNEGDTLVVLE
jgi:acetyl-CoA carboxylase biotin carboxyl carrier protein